MQTIPQRFLLIAKVTSGDVVLDTDSNNATKL